MSGLARIPENAKALTAGFDPTLPCKGGWYEGFDSWIHPTRLVVLVRDGSGEGEVGWCEGFDIWSLPNTG